MTTDMKQPGADWLQIVRSNGTSEFAKSFAPGVTLHASVIDKPLTGVDQLSAFFAATSKMYERLAFVAETIDGPLTVLEWEGLAAGIPVFGATLVRRDTHGRIASVQLFHSPLSVVRRFSADLAARLSDKLGREHSA